MWSAKRTRNERAQSQLDFSGRETMHTRPLLGEQEDMEMPEVRPTVGDLGQKRHQKRTDKWRMRRYLLCVAVISQMETVALCIC